MTTTIDAKLDLMARSLQEHINLAKELNLNFVAQLLTMTAMEIRINLHRISQALEIFDPGRLRHSSLSGLGCPWNQLEPVRRPASPLPAVEGSNHCGFG